MIEKGENEKERERENDDVWSSTNEHFLSEISFSAFLFHNYMHDKAVEQK